MTPADPIGQFEHSHGRLSARALEVSTRLRAANERPAEATTWDRLETSLAELRDELLRHFADEEEALFPFVRASVPRVASTVDRLEAAHDTICGCAVRMVHVATGERHLAALSALHDRFERAFAAHSSEEGELFEDLGRLLDRDQRAELALRLRGL